MLFTSISNSAWISDNVNDIAVRQYASRRPPPFRPREDGFSMNNRLKSQNKLHSINARNICRSQNISISPARYSPRANRCNQAYFRHTWHRRHPHTAHRTGAPTQTHARGKNTRNGLVPIKGIGIDLIYLVNACVRYVRACVCAFWYMLCCSVCVEN